jgi:hypothetical protein
MGDDKQIATGEDKKYQELLRKNVTFSAFPQRDPPKTLRELWSHAVEYYFNKKYSDSIHVFGISNTFSDIISSLDGELNPTISGKKPCVLGDLNIFTHGRQVEKAGKFAGTEFNLKFTAHDKDNWVSEEELEKYLGNWLKVSPSLKWNLVHIKDRLDSKSTIWFRGCNIGKSKKILKLVHEMFWGKPKVCGYDLRSWLSFDYNAPIKDKDFKSVSVSLIDPTKKKGNKLKEGTPEFQQHVVCYP